MNCNLCGLSCNLNSNHPSGLLFAEAVGGYDSTPGNGYGALDDGNVYTFSLCEFCLDWLFGKFRIPVTVRDYHTEEVQEWQPAEVRVRNDPSLDQKSCLHFFSEKVKRDQIRKK